MKITELAEDRLVIHLGNNAQVDIKTHTRLVRLMEILEQDEMLDLKNLNVSYTGVTVQWNLSTTNIETVKCRIYSAYLATKNLSDTPMKKQVLKIPVCYEEVFGIDQKKFSLPKEELIKRHTTPLYYVYMVGFLPGFLYLGGLDEALYHKRRDTPRRKVKKGSVGIGGTQTGVYPMDAPGGWHIIGKTPIELVKEGMPIVNPGDYIKFYSISLKDYWRIYND